VHDMVLPLCLWIKPQFMTIQVKAIEQCLHVVAVKAGSKPADEALLRDHSNKSY